MDLSVAEWRHCSMNLRGVDAVFADNAARVYIIIAW
jgi:hypothetical protein